MTYFNWRTLKCCVPECSSPLGTYLHTFPDDYELHLKWVEAVKRPDLANRDRMSIIRLNRVCTLHFSENCKYKTEDGRYVLIQGAIPTLLLPATTNNENKPLVKRRTRKRKQKNQIVEEENEDEYVNFNEVCRVCLTSSNQLTDINKVVLGDLTVPDVFEQYIAIKMNIDDELPKQLCTMCLYELCRVYLFINNCREADEKLKELVSESEKLDSDTESNFEDIVDDTKEPAMIMESGPPYTCKVCLESFMSLEDINKHKILTKHHSMRIFSCKLCTTDKMYTTLRAWKTHMRTHTGVRPYECHICGKKFRTHSSKRRHILLHTGEKPYICNYCGKGFRQTCNLKTHKVREHAGLGPDAIPGLFPCEFCHKVFTTKAAMINHRVLHLEKKYLCNKCGKAFYYESQLKRHIELHEKVPSYECSVCERKFTTPLGLKLQKRSHLSVKKTFECGFCQRQFAQKAHLVAHTRTHTGEKPYKCPYCEKRFSLNGNLTAHIRKHTGENPFVCDICSRGFTNSSSMKRHRRRHFAKID